MVSVDDVRAAAGRIVGAVRPTPLWETDGVSNLLGRQVLMKPEHRQRTGSFKVRGATNRIAVLDPVPEAGVVAASAGNHGQAVAFAARRRGIPATVFMPKTASLPKVEATQAYGATTRLEADTVDDAIAAARAWSADTGAVFVPPFDDPHVVAGQGTVGLELADEAPGAEAVVVPVGGGGLISGVAVALAALRPDVRVIGVEAAGAASMRASLDAGSCVRLARADTMADGIALKSPCDLTLDLVQAHVDDVVTVTEEEISRALLLLLERVKAVVEPSGAVGLAALLAGKVPGRGPAVTVLTGGNVDSLLLLKLIDHGLTAAGRYLVLRVIVDDQPGSLAALTAAVADLDLNVLSVEHHRSGLALGMEQVEVLLTVETRDPTHRGEVVAALGTAGFKVELVR